MNIASQPTILPLLAAQTQKTPDAIALACDDRLWTYAELERRSNQLAHYLLKHGLKQRHQVGIYFDRTPEIVVAILGILKAGGVYVPLDSNSPARRLQFICKDTDMDLVLTGASSKLPADVAVKNINFTLAKDEIYNESITSPPSQVRGEHLAYIVYTSGSTGCPKGVRITHENVRRYIDSIAKVLAVTADDTFLHTASFSFSSSIRQLFVPVTQGARVLMARHDQTRNPLTLFELIVDKRVTVFDTVQSVWRYGLQALEKSPQRLADLKQSQLRLLVFSGDLLPCYLLKKICGVLAQRPRIVNVYGQTETIGVCAFSVPAEFNRDEGFVPVGIPYDHIRADVVDDRLQPLAAGEVGELAVAIVGQERVYQNDERMNAAKFIAGHCADNQSRLLYRTGDIAKMLPDGNLEILGRKDYQTKIRGMRVEPGEIEVALEQHPQVLKAVITVHQDDGENRLAAYILTDSARIPTISALREFLDDRLPDYMIPATFMFLDELPMTPNNKLDRSGLPAPTFVRLTPSGQLVAPRDEIESRLLEIWERVLGVQPLSVDDDFFDLGGHSLLALRLFSEIERQFGRNLPLTSILKAPSIEKIAATIRQKASTANWKSLVPIQPKGSRPPFFCVHGAGGNVVFFRDLAKFLGDDQPFYGLQSASLDEKNPPYSSIEEMASRYLEEIRSVQAKGPYSLGGFCMGGMVAFEMARQLDRDGEKIGMVALIESHGPDYFVFAEEGAVYYWNDTPLFMRIAKNFRRFFSMTVEQRRMLIAEKSAQARKTFSQFSTKIWARVQKLLRIYETPPLLKLRQNNIRAQMDYRPKSVYPGKVHLFQVANQPKGDYRFDPFFGWSSWAKGGIEILDVPGFHGTIMKHPNVLIFARQLQKNLDSVVC